jgi:hypothetical protein
MSNTMIVLTPVLIFFIIALFGFVGCGTTLPYDDPPPEADPQPDPKPKSPYDPTGPLTPPTGPHLPPAATTYESLVTGTKGFVALWPLNETLGKVAAVVGPLSPSANGTYKSATGGDPSAASYSLGKLGVLYPKDNQDFAVEFTGTEALIEVEPFIASLNPSPAVPGFTIELWAKPNPNAGADRGVMVSSHHFDSATVQQGYEVGLLKVAGQPHHQIYGRVYGNSAMAEISIQPVDGDPSEWRHIVFKYEFVAGTGYVLRLRAQLLNGVQVYQAQSPGPVVYENVTSAKPSTFRIAGSHLPPPGTSSLFAGQLDNVAFYAAPLSDAEIKDHFAFA